VHAVALPTNSVPMDAVFAVSMLDDVLNFVARPQFQIVRLIAVLDWARLVFLLFKEVVGISREVLNAHYGVDLLVL